MTYNKPEVVVLGPAALAIQGALISGQQDPGSNPVTYFKTADCELDD